MDNPFPMPSNGIISSVQEADAIVQWIDDLLIDMLGEMAATADAIVDGCTIAVKEIMSELRSQLYKPVNKIGRDVKKIMAMVDTHLPLEVYENVSQDSTLGDIPASILSSRTAADEVPAVQTGNLPAVQDTPETVPQESDNGTDSVPPIPVCQNGQARLYFDPVTGCTHNQLCIDGQWVNQSTQCPPSPPPGPPITDEEGEPVCKGVFPAEWNCTATIGGWNAIATQAGQMVLSFVQGNIDHWIDYRSGEFKASPGSGDSNTYIQKRAVPIIAYQPEKVFGGINTVWGDSGEQWIRNRMGFPRTASTFTDSYDTVNEFLNDPLLTGYPYVADGYETDLSIPNI